MKRFPFVIGLLSALLLLTLLFGISQSQQPGGNKHLDLTSDLGDEPPGYCTLWEEIYPVRGEYYHQIGYVDGDGDGRVSPCDEITLQSATGTVRYHIADVVPTFYFVTEFGEVIYEGQIDYYQYEGQDAVCQWWIQIFPPDMYMEQVHIDDWVDGDGNGYLSDSDDVLIRGSWEHIQKIGLDIVIGEEENPIERGTWGSIKSFFHQLVH